MNLILSREAAKQYRLLPKPEQNKIKRKLASLENDPYAGKKLLGELSDFRSYKSWPYRIIFSINEQLKRVEVHSIQHRQGVYKHN